MTTRVRAADTVLADDLFTALGLVRRTARRAAGRPWPLEELAGAHLELLRLVRRSPGIAVAAAAAELGLAANTVSTLVGQLVESGQLTRTPDPVDRRVARLELTPPARQRMERWRDQRTEVAAAAIRALSPSDRVVLERAIPVLTALALELGAA